MKNIGKIFVVLAMLIGLSGNFVYADVFNDLKISFKSNFPRTTDALNRVNGYVQNKLPDIKLSSYRQSLSGGFAKFPKIESPAKIAAGLTTPLSPVLQSGVQLGRGVYNSLNDKYNSLSSISLKSYTQDINSSLTKIVQYSSPTRIASGLVSPLSPYLKSGAQLGQDLYTSLNNKYNSLSSINLASYSNYINSGITQLAQYASPTRIVAGLTASLSSVSQYGAQLGQSLNTSLNDRYTKLSNINLKNYAHQKIASFNSLPSLNTAMAGLFSPLVSSLKYNSSLVGKGFSNHFSGTEPSRLVKVAQIR